MTKAFTYKAGVALAKRKDKVEERDIDAYDSFSSGLCCQPVKPQPSNSSVAFTKHEVVGSALYALLLLLLDDLVSMGDVYKIYSKNSRINAFRL